MAAVSPWSPAIRGLSAPCGPPLPCDPPPLLPRLRSVGARRSVLVCSAGSRGRLAAFPAPRSGVAERPHVAGAEEEEEEGCIFSETFPLRRTQTVEGKVWVRVQSPEEGRSKRRVEIGCNLEGKWVLHWGVTYAGDLGSEWDQPPQEMRPPGSIVIKGYAVETPFVVSSTSEGQRLHELQIDFDDNASISAINFVLKEEETGAWFQHKGRDFKIFLGGSFEDEVLLNGNQGYVNWPGTFEQISNFLLKSEPNVPTPETTSSESEDARPQSAVGYCKEYSFLKEELVQNNIMVTVKKSKEKDKKLVEFDTDIPGQVIVHWGVCRDGSKTWEIPSLPLPSATKVFRQKALQTVLEPKSDGIGSHGLFTVDAEFSGLFFVLKLNEYTWLRSMDKGTDFYVPLASKSISFASINTDTKMQISEKLDVSQDIVGKQEHFPASSNENLLQSSNVIGEPARVTESSPVKDQDKADGSVADEIVTEIRKLMANISSQKDKRATSKEANKNIIQEIEKLAAEAYNIFKGSDAAASSVDSSSQIAQVTSGTGSGYEILCQGFNWESHKSGRWYIELGVKVKELSSLGFTIVWLPPPTDSVSPEGYMPRDLYNLNSRYGNMEELKDLVKRFHEVGLRVLGDVVLNHRCASFRNHKGIWNIFGGRLNWDDRAVVGDDPHFQGRGNKSSGDNFHAAPNIDHSQDFVRKDLKDWLRWLRKEVGYDGWRLDFVRGFWGGYVKDYIEATEPYFAVGEYWDSLSYTYNVMDYDQDAHRQRIIDWINATNGAAGAFDVTTKGVLHTALQRCEYWRLSDPKGKPPGVVGWWPSRAVTFIENHDTGSTQGHWRFPSGKEMQGYAYILTHPGTPAVFYDHMFSHYQQEISKLISVRRQHKIHCRSKLKIIKAEREVYAAEIDEKIMMKIGPGHYEPPSGPQKWSLAAEGQDYKVWSLA